jgi:hypothetical protein
MSIGNNKKLIIDLLLRKYKMIVDEYRLYK